MPVVQNTSTEEQEKLLETAISQVKHHGFQMKTSLDNNQLMDALKNASTILQEMRTALLSPKNYYELYMSVCDQLQHLEQFLLVEYQKSKNLTNLYEMVQYAGNIVPRLYLLVTVGSIYMRTKEATRKNILKDLVEMCRGVQHPLRGLFLRNYLLQSTRNQLPDVDTVESFEEGSIDDSVSFIIANFSEMNKLWVRMQHQGHTKEKAKREKERQELRILVGTNLVRLSQLDGVDSNIYRKEVLPKVLEQVTGCHDPIAQTYLMECIIQVFPEEFHLATLTPFLKACSELEAVVSVKDIIITLIDRLASYAQREDSAGIPANIPLFDIFSQEVSQVIQARQDMSQEDIVALQYSLINLSLKVYPDKIHYVNKVLTHTTDIFSKKDISSISSTSTAGKELANMMKTIVEAYKETLTLLQVESFPNVLEMFDFRGRKNIALKIVEVLLENNILVPSVEEVEKVLKLVNPLVTDQDDKPDEEVNSDLFTEEQEQVARLIHHFRADHPDKQYAILVATRKSLESGGETRLKFSLPPIVFGCYQLVFRYHSLRAEDERWQRKCEKILDFCHKTVLTLNKVIPDISLRMFLQGALAADRIGLEKEAYEFISQSFSVFEEDISDSKQQVSSLFLIIATFEQMQSLGEENHETLRTNCARSASNLLKKPDQCRAVAICSHLFWSGKVKGQDEDVGEECHDKKRVAECLKKCGRITSQCMEGVQVQLYIELLNTYMLFYEKGNSQITPSFLKQLIDKIKDELTKLEDSDEAKQIKQHFLNTLTHIKLKQRLSSEGEDGPSYDGIVVQ